MKLQLPGDPACAKMPQPEVQRARRRFWADAALSQLELPVCAGSRPRLPAARPAQGKPGSAAAHPPGACWKTTHHCEFSGHLLGQTGTQISVWVLQSLRAKPGPQEVMKSHTHQHLLLGGPEQTMPGLFKCPSLGQTIQQLDPCKPATG